MSAKTFVQSLLVRCTFILQISGFLQVTQVQMSRKVVGRTCCAIRQQLFYELVDAFTMPLQEKQTQRKKRKKKEKRNSIFTSNRPKTGTVLSVSPFHVVILSKQTSASELNVRYQSQVPSLRRYRIHQQFGYALEHSTSGSPSARHTRPPTPDSCERVLLDQYSRSEPHSICSARIPRQSQSLASRSRLLDMAKLGRVT